MKAPTHIQTYRPLTYARSIRAQARARSSLALRWMAGAYMMAGAVLTGLLALNFIGLIAGGSLLLWTALTWMVLFFFHLVPSLLTQFYKASMSRGLWQRAEVAQGVVTQVRALDGDMMMVAYQYDTDDGQRLTDTTHINRARLEEAVESQRSEPSAPFEGALIQVAYDRAAPHLNLVPAFREDLFEAVRQDRRPWLDTSHGIAEPPKQGGPETLVLKTPDIDQKSAWWQRTGNRVGRARLIVSDEGLTLTGNSEEPARMRWDKPFAVSLSAWIVSTDEVDLHVRVRQRGLPASAPSVAFAVRLPQRIVDRRVPLKQENLPMLDTAEFERLWGALRHFAQIHGDPLEERLALGGHERPEAAQQQAVQAEAVHVVSR